MLIFRRFLAILTAFVGCAAVYAAVDILNIRAHAKVEFVPWGLLLSLSVIVVLVIRSTVWLWQRNNFWWNRAKRADVLTLCLAYLSSFVLPTIKKGLTLAQNDAVQLAFVVWLLLVYLFLRSRFGLVSKPAQQPVDR